MFGKIDPKRIEGMMKKMGIAQQNIDAKRVIIECEGENIIIDEPNVVKINMQGQESFQVTGEPHTEASEEFSEDDVKMVMEKTGKDRDDVVEALKNSGGDIASAIMELK